MSSWLLWSFLGLAAIGAGLTQINSGTKVIVEIFHWCRSHLEKKETEELLKNEQPQLVAT